MLCFCKHMLLTATCDDCISWCAWCECSCMQILGRKVICYMWCHLVLLCSDVQSWMYVASALYYMWTCCCCQCCAPMHAPSCIVTWLHMPLVLLLCWRADTYCDLRVSVPCAVALLMCTHTYRNTCMLHVLMQCSGQDMSTLHASVQHMRLMWMCYYEAHAYHVLLMVMWAK